MRLQPHRPRPRAIVIVVALAAASSLMLAGCSSETPSAAASGRINVVASTDVWGDIASDVGGSHVSVDSIIDDPSQDPHSYEADARVQLALSKAHVVIENGGGYDDFMTTLEKGAHNADAVVLNAADESGLDQTPAGGDFNEHIWYDFPVVKRVVEKMVTTFSRIDAEHAPSYRANADAFESKLATLEGKESAIKAASAGKGAAITEPVPLYMLEACGLENKTPLAFSEAVEEGTDVSPLVLKTTLGLFRNHRVDVLAYNSQTSGPETEAVIAAAKKAGIAVVPVTETLPAHTDYISWMTDNLAAIARAVA